MSKTYKNYFPLQNVIFFLNLSPGEIAVYSYLLYCEDRKTYQYYPSYKTIGRAVGMSINTVQKYIAALGEKGFISIEPTSVITKSGQKRNGSYRYTIRPIQEVVESYHQRQLRKLEIKAARSRFTAEAAP
ncbi:MAG: helix-turn-helix domain-containing protein [Oscillospiraceae bacterium]|jgi:predicted transcriptional regulator|nr:helix-turn-helix domain-containing protein [Oscillospiraceae bacterium]